MPRLILKPNRDLNFYVLWSSIVEAPIDAGTRQELVVRRGMFEASPERFERADELGSSGYRPSWGGWGDRYIMAEQRLLPRENLHAYALAWLYGDRERMHELTEDPEEEPMPQPTGNVTHPEGKHRAECAQPGCPWTFESQRDGEAAHALMEHNEREHS